MPVRTEKFKQGSSVNFFQSAPQRKMQADCGGKGVIKALWPLNRYINREYALSE